MAEIIKLTESQGDDFAEYGEYSRGGDNHIEFDGHVYTYVDIVERYEEHRWNYTDQIIFERDDNKLFALNYDIGLTEEQENGFMYNSPKLYEVVKKEKIVKTVEYVKTD